MFPSFFGAFLSTIIALVLEQDERVLTHCQKELSQLPPSASQMITDKGLTCEKDGRRILEILNAVKEKESDELIEKLRNTIIEQGQSVKS